jgi:hypothetical protein
VCDDVKDVSGVRIDDRKSVDPAVQQCPDGVEEAGVGIDGDQLLDLVKDV